jgi:D-alanyl-D-alanine carboxypeptidase
MKRRHIISVTLIATIVFGYLWLRPTNIAAPSTNSSSTLRKTDGKSQQQSTSSFNKSKYSLTDPSSIWVIVNKQHPLQPVSYKPHDLVLPKVSQRVPGAEEMKMRAEAASALEKLFAGADKAGVHLLISTAYRGYSYQKSLYNGYVASQGQATADTQSARPGYSEHQTGLVVDIRSKTGQCAIEQCFGNLPEGQWLAANAYKYGFLLRYPEDKESITGYEYEPWHYRYIGTALSQELHRTRTQTLEEFFGVSGGKSYN